MAEKPSVLIIGGLGYIGRFLALYIHQNNLASEVRVVDKVLPQLAWLAPEFEEACAGDKFMQADASREQALARIFDRTDGKEWDYVFNCGGETRYSQEDEVYKLRSLALSLAVGKEAAKRKVKAFVELSTGMVYKSDSSASKEGDKLKPWSRIATFKLQAEEELAKVAGLNLVIVRLPHVYGPYASQWVATALCMARVYKSQNEEMKWLWTKDLRTNTVHIHDVTRALWSIVSWYDAGKANWDDASMGKVPTFNVVDKGVTTQGVIADIIGQIFEIKTGFQGQLISTFARLNMDSVVDDVNDELLGPWADLLADAGITRPGPLTPFMEKELLKDTDLSMDGTRLEKVVGFQYEKPKITKELIEEVIESYKKMKWWP
ncbi:putative nad dependent epimerase dehydratase family protein [Phaeoacremonium minimum UCRPA7]|uniref:Putative nad dependent epimerase dehydratase family protein n=1 Tax=Phaeoacremonium minimum (strain UCR-PA7) TaxID=1286976 RepID=R8BF59_PHAM7|nr:putative nad dependent epimerase dehydratase family protein [Phaeoacremonium minimum UCRPA7]EON97929.1 putative nad dependent epimerase dehydratase family protein [Phaeoacremonium minimum UCRPA7]